ncbi:hypothetical protein [Streptomyces lunalinharesii]|uniref:Uncharacterized protein n=1 Tax=Streptomyces lunalinharesii TaxID=333384 RepID=A0ABP6E5M9_9ACTN
MIGKLLRKSVPNMACTSRDESAFEGRSSPDRQFQPLLRKRLRDLRNAYNAHTTECFPQPRGLVAYVVTGRGDDGSKEFSQLRERAKAQGQFVNQYVRERRGCPPNERSGWATVRATVYEGFAHGVIVLDQETVSSDLEAYEREVRWFGERNALLLLVRAETST